MILIGIHPFLVHLLIAGAFVYLMGHWPGLPERALSPFMRPLAKLLLALLPSVFFAGLLSRHLILEQHPELADRIRIHLWTGVIVVLAWWPFVWRTAKENPPVEKKAFGKRLLLLLVLGGLTLTLAATEGGWLVYGHGAIAFPVR